MPRAVLGSLLNRNSAEIIAAWAGALKEMSGSSFESRPQKELESLCTDLLRGFLEALETNSYETISQIVSEGVNRAKFLLGFSPGEELAEALSSALADA